MVGIPAFPMVRVAAVVFEETWGALSNGRNSFSLSSKTTAATLTIGNAVLNICPPCALSSSKGTPHLIVRVRDRLHLLFVLIALACHGASDLGGPIA